MPKMPGPDVRELIDSLLGGLDLARAESLRDRVVKEKSDLTGHLERLHREMEESEPQSHYVIGFTDEERDYAKAVDRFLDLLAQSILGHWMNLSESNRLRELLYGKDPNRNPNRFASALHDLAYGRFDVAPAVDALIGDLSPPATRILTRIHTRVDFERHGARLEEALSDAREPVREDAARILAGHYFRKGKWEELASRAQERDPLIRRGIAQGLWDVTIGEHADFTPLVPVLELMGKDENEEVRKLGQDALQYARRFTKRAR